MNGCLAVLRKELAVYFSTPIFYLTGTFFLILGGYFFFSNVAYYNLLSFQAAQNPYLASQLNPGQMVFRPLLGTLAVVFLFLVPLITMRLFAEEKRSGTAELLFTYPLTDWGVILGKFLAALLVYAVLLGLTLIYGLVFAWVTPLDWGQILTGYLGLFLLGGTFLALGLFSSTLTENQIIAAVVTFGLLLLFWVIGWYEELGPSGWQAFFRYISLMSHFETFSRGVIDSRDLLFYLLFIYFFLFLTKRQLESRRWRG
ncbi:MAG: ABC transporter permease subunit [Deltaproteobacteria bacterium]|nr:ABC transporter permease subunit [Deltaproteobacteria bacterium]MBW1952477.1 ABC transporter permease subunit [Deltaproteobacteria bacterium]MBW1987406.1 ABC transporter permease subunit [Deltaproteobacteria bacterium]MBW2135189.1 ABC transporter permease subunit [Deltaproteobacteria bacterium]